MRNIQNILIGGLLTTFFLFSCEKKPASNASTSFKVYGNCEMCKKTIETSLEVEGVASAAWDQNTKMISVAYDSTILNEEKLHKLIAGSGYDTEKETASTDTYNNLPECCQYKRKQEMN